MKELYYSALDLAVILYSMDLNAREEAILMEKVWVYERGFLYEEYRNNKHHLILDVAYWQHYLDNKATIDAEFPAIQNDLRAIGRQTDTDQFVGDDIDLDLFFKFLRFRILFCGNQSYARIKLRTLLKVYGYKRRSTKLMEHIQKCLTFFHLKPYLRGTLCEIDEISLDDMITFRVS